MRSNTNRKLKFKNPILGFCHPSSPEQPVREKKKKQPKKSGEQVEKIEIANREMYANRAAESGHPHHRDNLNKASRERCAARHK